MNNVQCPSSQFEPLVRQLAPLGIEEYNTIVKEMINGGDRGFSGFTPNEESVMQYISNQIFVKFEIRERQSA